MSGRKSTAPNRASVDPPGDKSRPIAKRSSSSSSSSSADNRSDTSNKQTGSSTNGSDSNRPGPMDLDAYFYPDNMETKSSHGQLPFFKDQVRGEHVRVRRRDTKPAGDDHGPEGDIDARAGTMILPSFKDQVADKEICNINNVNIGNSDIIDTNADGDEFPLGPEAASSIAFADALILPTSRNVDNGGVWHLPSDLQIQTVPINNTAGETPTDKSQNDISSSTGVKNKRFQCYIALLLFVVGLLSFAIIFPIIKKDEATTVDVESGNEITTMPVSSTPTPTGPPTAHPTPTTSSLVEAQDIVDYINSITLTQKNLQYPPPLIGASAEEAALQFLIEEDAFVASGAAAAETGSDLDLWNLWVLQRYVLAVIYSATGGPTWFRKWDLSATVDESTLYGIQCTQVSIDMDSSIDVAVISDFSLTNNNLQGTLPLDLALLEYIENIDVSLNEGLSGSIPAVYTASANTYSIWRMLHKWNSSSSSLSGSLPGFIGNWRALEQFDVGYCFHTGSLPNNIGAWTALEVFSIYKNQLTGTLSENIGAWNSLTSFGAGNNQFTGTLPASIGNWTLLTFFDISDNQLSGTLPASIGAWTSLTKFDVVSNQLNGTLPESIGAWTSLKYAFVYFNQLTGTLPESIGNWMALQEGYFYDNRLVGSVPVGLCTAATYLDELQVDCEVECSCCVDCV